MENKQNNTQETVYKNLLMSYNVNMLLVWFESN